MFIILGRFDPAFEEAATDLGATPRQRFQYVILPLILPGLIGIAMAGFTSSYEESARAGLNIGTGNTMPMELTGLLGAATTGALIGPVSFHRLLTGQRLKPQTVIWASRLTVLGLFLLLGTMASALLLILRLVLDDTLALWLVAAMVLWFVLCWFVLPLWTLIKTPGKEGPPVSPRAPQ